MNAHCLTGSAIVLLFLSLSAYAQSDGCSCRDGFEELSRKVESNYIGLALMRERDGAEGYDAYRRHFLQKAASVPADQCVALMQDFLDFFDDGHLFAFERPTYDDVRIEAFRNNIKQASRNVDRIVAELDGQDTGPPSMIGRWYDGQSEIAVIREGARFNAYLLDTAAQDHEPGELKGSFAATSDGWEGTYYSYGFAPRFLEGNLYKQGELLVWTGGIYWARRNPRVRRELQAPVAEPVIEALDDETTLFTIPSFLVDGQRFTDLILDHVDLFKQSRYMIVDVRGNVGGNALYFLFLDAFADRDLPGGQGLVLASVDTQSYFAAARERAPDVYGPVVERLIDNAGEIVDGPAYPARSFEDFPTRLERIAILADRGTMSAAESFILHATQASDRVQTFGEPTGGVIDYTSIHTVKLGCPIRNVYLGYPTSTLHKDIPEDGHNQTGLIPDVPIPDNIDDPISFIRGYFASNE